LEAVLEGGNRASRERGSAPFEVFDKNIEISVPVARGVDIDGRVVLAEGASKPDLAKIQLRLSPIGWVSFLGDEQNPIDAQGKFRIVNTAIRDQQLYVSGLRAPHYVKEVRYNGHRISDNIVQMDAGAPSHSLEIVVDDKPAAVMGAVTDRDKPVSRPSVVLARWPLNTIDWFYSVIMATGDENGKFSFTGLAPGDYRVFAVASEVKGKLDEPGVMEQLLSRAEKMSLNERTVQNVALKLAVP
jgi:hypothetical protein